MNRRLPWWLVLLLVAACGESPAPADISIYAYASLAGDAGLSLAPHPHFRAWVARVEAQPRFLAQGWDYSIDPHSSGELPD